MRGLRICSICELRASEHVCKKCGLSVCISHYDLKSGLCDRCRLGPSVQKFQQPLKK